jgi:hypothetical protein
MGVSFLDVSTGDAGSPDRRVRNTPKRRLRMLPEVRALEDTITIEIIYAQG